MHTEEKTPAVAHFKDLDYGIFALASFAREESLYCVKGYVRDEDEELHDRLVSIWPFPKDTGDYPSLFDSCVLGDDYVLDVSKSTRICPIYSPNSMLEELPATRDQIGHILARKNEVFLGVRSSRNGGAGWQTAYLNLTTGEVRFRIGSEGLIALAHWEILELDPNGDWNSVYRHEPLPALKAIISMA